ncbi:Sec-independent protein translocase (Twin-arginine translocation protein) [Flavobacterium sp. 9AF]|uniref:Sec-independent protein translocase subunit TatA/TatB n=1 Tax=Flavobacterium sp. 9AF TaxID=2653142 RepID=UPI0012F0C001|nr:twin-arginine translocase TatA/TatE family subunit [Flavobacterium sp. 9AF]VXB11071.1 Sec-independent protein translocase (Twin-arginine translocation protein) [Flavobacterium sp. 9AF]
MFGIGFSEFFFVVVVILMLFGSKEIPQMARFLGKTMAQLKNATNEIKREIHNSAKDADVDVNSLTGGISDEIRKAKEGIANTINPLKDMSNHIVDDITKPIEEVKEDIENLSGPIKRQF